MQDQPGPINGFNEIQQITIDLPYQLAKRVEKYAEKNGMTVTGVAIEALAAFLRSTGAD